MIDAYKKYWTRFADFSGRTSRRDYWLFVLMNIIVSIVLTMILSALLGRGLTVSNLKDAEEIFNLFKSGSVAGTISLIWYLLNIIPSLSISVRRMHDINKSGWAILVLLIPLIGWLIYFIFTIKPSVNENNKYAASN